MKAQLPMLHDEHLNYTEVLAQFPTPLGELNYNKISDIKKIDMSKFDNNMAKLGENCIHPIINVLNALEDIERYEHHNEIVFDYVVRVRPDSVYRKGSTIDLPVENDIVYINNGLVYPNDWLVCATIQTFQKIYESLYAEFVKPTSIKSTSKPPHGIFDTVFDKLNLNVVQKPYIQGLLRADDFLDNYISLSKLQSAKFRIRKIMRSLRNKVFK